MKIIIGAGEQRIPDFKTCDYDPLMNPDYLFDLEHDKFPFDNNTVDVIVAHHILEHLGEGYFHCLKEMYRVCHHGSQIHIEVPYFRHSNFFDDPTHRRPITLNGLRMFSKKHNQMAREQRAHASRLADYYNVDFEILDFGFKMEDKMNVDLQNLTQEEVFRYLDQHNNMVTDLWATWIVIKQ